MVYHDKTNKNFESITISTKSKCFEGESRMVVKSVAVHLSLSSTLLRLSLYLTLQSANYFLVVALLCLHVFQTNSAKLQSLAQLRHRSLTFLYLQFGLSQLFLLPSLTIPSSSL